MTALTSKRTTKIFCADEEGETTPVSVSLQQLQLQDREIECSETIFDDLKGLREDEKKGDTLFDPASEEDGEDEVEPLHDQETEVRETETREMNAQQVGDGLMAMQDNTEKQLAGQNGERVDDRRVVIGNVTPISDDVHKVEQAGEEHLQEQKEEDKVDPLTEGAPAVLEYNIAEQQMMMNETDSEGALASLLEGACGSMTQEVQADHVAEERIALLLKEQLAGSSAGDGETRKTCEEELSTIRTASTSPTGRTGGLLSTIISIILLFLKRFVLFCFLCSLFLNLLRHGRLYALSLMWRCLSIDHVTITKNVFQEVFLSFVLEDGSDGAGGEAIML
ncbi:unnamed protein product [Amoebophrya sp. A25]|nr:unnamed protein product [Amoebophrya sp. A25]|eukprot:GSA25T00012888001.1